MYADTITDSMRAALDETQRRREVQMAYNEEHGITPKTIQKAVRDLIAVSKKVAASEVQMEKDPESMSEKELEKLIKELEKQMKKEFDADKRSDLAIQMQQTILDDNAYVFCSHLRMSMIMQSNVTGLTAHPCDYYELTADLDIN